ncbi:MAG: O-antigen ligase family protein [Rhodospirillales bacterium]|nr:O-antigen ligase family protein [Rhodospirillales bacterium]
MRETNFPMLGASRAIRFRLREGHVLAAAAFLLVPVATFVPRALAVIFAASAVATIIAATLNRRWPDIRSPLVVGLALFFLWGLASAAWSITPGESGKTAISLGATFFGGLILVRTVANLGAAEWNLFERSLIAGGIVGYSILFIELVGGHPLQNAVMKAVGRPFTVPSYAIYFLNPGLAIASLFAWPWLLCLWRRAPLLAAAAAVGIGVIVGLGDAEAPRVGLALGGVACLAALAFPRAMVWAAGALVGLGVLAAPLLPKALPPTAELVREAPNLAPSVYHRIAIWQVAVKHVEQAPILGHGFDTARALYGKETKVERSFYDKEGVRRWVSQYEPIPLHPHNGILQIWLELGTVGALLGGAILLSVVRAIGRHGGRRLDRAMALGVFVAGLFIASVSFGIWQSWWLCGLWLVGAFTAAVMCREERAPDRQTEHVA